MERGLFGIEPDEQIAARLASSSVAKLEKIAILSDMSGYFTKRGL
jgi:hypothetical protein